MPEPRVIALEGLPFTGKSMTAAALQRETGAVVVIPDYHELISMSDRTRMATLPKSAEDQHSRLTIYRSIDNERWRRVARLSGNPLVIFDRCFLSIRAYSTALSRTYSKVLPPEFFDRTQAANIGSEARMPPEVIYLDVDLDVAVDRHRRLSTSIDVRLRSREFLANLIDAYKVLLAACRSEVTVVSSNRPLDDVVGGVRGYVYGDK